MKKQRGYISDGQMMAMFVAASVALVVIGFVLDAWACHSKWERSGMAGVSYGPIQGCLVKMPDGRWLPAERIREIDIPKETRK